MSSDMMAIVVHGGAGANSDNQDGCDSAARTGWDILSQNRAGLDAVIAAVQVMEDDGRFNAGTGSALRLDGITVEMDAAVMDAGGCLGAVACLRDVRNPVLVAREISQTPHWLLTGEGAQRFARQAGLAGGFASSEDAHRRHREMMERLLAAGDGDGLHAFSRHWNFPTDWNDAIERYGCGTVGAVARDSNGNFSVATSTGGCAPALLGRVGDTPIVGCGYHAGAAGAVAATGIGEHIVRLTLSRTVYQWIEAGIALETALARGIGLFPKHIGVGLIAVSRSEAGALSNRAMPWRVM
jgi:beta-aspartyl-peptidase (threonine type)